MQERTVYTLGRWLVRPGSESEFIETWKELGEYFLSLPQPPGPGVLLQSAQDDRLFYSFGPWPSDEAVAAMRADPRTEAEIGKLVAVCEDATPGMFHTVAEVG